MKEVDEMSIISLTFDVANKINNVLDSNPTTLEFVNALNRFGLVFHHAATARGYSSRRHDNGVATPYEGRFGFGIIIHRPRYNTTQYHTIVYYVFERGMKNKIKLYDYIDNLATDLVRKTPVEYLTGAFANFALSFAYVYAGMLENEISFEDACTDFLARCSQKECDIAFKLCCIVQDVKMTECFMKAHSKLHKRNDFELL